MDRRTFIGTMAGSLLVAALPVRAQQIRTVRRIGILSAGTLSRRNWAPFLETMRALGWIEDQNFVVEWRSAEDKPELLPGLAAELVHLKSDLIVAAGAVASQTDAAHLERVITEVARLKAEALIVRADPIFVANREQIAALALKHALPTIAEGGRFVSAGCLASYAPHYLEVGRGIATLVDQIFRGANPGDLPIRQPTKFELSFNLKTAKALGVAIPQTLLVRADEVIQ